MIAYGILGPRATDESRDARGAGGLDDSAPATLVRGLAAGGLADTARAVRQAGLRGAQAPAKQRRQ